MEVNRIAVVHTCISRNTNSTPLQTQILMQDSRSKQEGFRSTNKTQFGEHLKFPFHNCFFFRCRMLGYAAHPCQCSVKEKYLKRGGKKKRESHMQCGSASPLFFSSSTAGALLFRKCVAEKNAAVQVPALQYYPSSSTARVARASHQSTAGKQECFSLLCPEFWNVGKIPEHLGGAVQEFYGINIILFYRPSTPTTMACLG